LSELPFVIIHEALEQAKEAGNALLKLSDVTIILQVLPEELTKYAEAHSDWPHIQAMRLDVLRQLD
jgi:hypothetical protein